MRHLAALVSAALCFALAAPAGAQPFPDSIPLPDDFAPEGIATGAGTTFYAGSITLGDIYRGDLRTGEGAIFIDARAGRSALGLKADRRHGLLFVAGGFTGEAYVYDLRTGAPVASYQFGTPGASLVNDVIVTRDAAYFTDSFAPFLYVVPIGPGGELGSGETLALSGPATAPWPTGPQRHRGDAGRQDADRQPRRPRRAVHRRPLDRGKHRDRRRRAHRRHARRPAPPRPRPVGCRELPQHARTRQPQPRPVQRRDHGDDHEPALPRAHHDRPPRVAPRRRQRALRPRFTAAIRHRCAARDRLRRRARPCALTRLNRRGRPARGSLSPSHQPHRAVARRRPPPA